MEFNVRHKPVDPLSSAFLKPLKQTRNRADTRTVEMLITATTFMIITLGLWVSNALDYEHFWSHGNEMYKSILLMSALGGMVTTILQMLFIVESTSDRDNIVLQDGFFTGPYGIPGNHYLTVLFSLSLISAVTYVTVSVIFFGPVWQFSDYVWQYMAVTGYIVFSFAATYQMRKIWLVDKTIADALRDQGSYYRDLNTVV
jgi:hypothetical protein